MEDFIGHRRSSNIMIDSDIINAIVDGNGTPEMELELVSRLGLSEATKLLEKERRNRKKPRREDQSSNGVKVIVWHWPSGGTTVDADCNCFGHGPIHTNGSCPRLSK